MDLNHVPLAVQTGVSPTLIHLPASRRQKQHGGGVTDALRAGKFYASTGIFIDDYQVNKEYVH